MFVGSNHQINPKKRPRNESSESDEKKPKLCKPVSTQTRLDPVECSSSKALRLSTPSDLVIKSADAAPKCEESPIKIQIKIQEKVVTTKPSASLVPGGSTKPRPSLGPKSRVKPVVAVTGQNTIIKEEYVTHNCEMCNFEIVLKPLKSSSKTFVPFYDLYAYVKHIISHSKDDFFGEIPELDHFVCPHESCGSKITYRFNFMLHLATVHGEFLPRLDRRLKELRRVRELRHDEIAFLSNARKFVTKSYYFDVSSIPTPKTLCGEDDVFAAFEKNARGKKVLQCQVNFILFCNSLSSYSYCK